ncbi:hypothetical protein GGI12_001198 [Dipsacomyces acuminosporus]|nr:hypothetical protein GGI12_001198 [Dipsacomyces acuminosporus]
MDFLRPVFESGKIDFVGQRLASKLSYMLLLGSGAASLAAGFVLNSLSLCFLVYLGGVVLTYVAVLLPWPFFKRNPVVWLSKKSSEPAQAPAPIDSPNPSRKTLIEDVSDDSDDN